LEQIKDICDIDAEGITYNGCKVPASHLNIYYNNSSSVFYLLLYGSKWLSF